MAVYELSEFYNKINYFVNKHMHAGTDSYKS